MKILEKFFIFLLFGVNLYPNLNLEIKFLVGDSPKFVECEPMHIRISWRNIAKKDLKIGPPIKPMQSEALSIWVDGVRVPNFLPPWAPNILYSTRAPKILKPLQMEYSDLDIRHIGLPVGMHRIQAKVDFSNFPEGYFHGRVESNVIEFEILAPTGVDLEAYKYAEEYVKRRYPRENKIDKLSICMCLTENIIEDNFILENYPTSTYAGWALFELPNASWGEKNEKIDREKKKYKDMVEIFLEHHPEFVHSGTLALRAAYISLEFEDYKNACELFKKAIELLKKLPLTEKEEEIYKKLKDEGRCK